MFVALNTLNQHVTADEVERGNKKENGPSFYCPGCQNAVFIKKGKHIQAHFAHYAQNNCTLFSEGETEEHLSGKKLLYDWFTTQKIPCQLEAYLPRLKQRPDLLIWPTSDQPVAIEFQCSSLSIEKMIERTEGYQKNGYDVFWIVGSHFQLKQHLTPFQHLFLREHNVLGLYFVFLDVEKGQFEFFSHISLNQPGHYLHKQRKVFLLNKTTLPSMKSFVLLDKLKPKEEAKFSFLKSQDYLVKGRLYQNPKMVEFQKYIYYRGHSLLSLPREVYLPVENEILIKTIPHFWKFIILEWIKDKGIGTVFSKEEWDEKISEMKLQKEIEFFHSTFVSSHTKDTVLFDYLISLIQTNILLPLSNAEWVVVQLPKSYPNEREKLADFEKSDSINNKRLLKKIT